MAETNELELLVTFAQQYIAGRRAGFIETANDSRDAERLIERLANYKYATPPEDAALDDEVLSNITLPEHEPTIAIEEILDEYTDDSRIDVWESITTYADIHARNAVAAALRARAVAQPAPEGWILVKDCGTHGGGTTAEDHAYCDGWNACRDAMLSGEPELRALMGKPAPEGMAMVPVSFVEFLLGEREHECGLWFGDAKPMPKGLRAKFWWRSELRDMLTDTKVK